MMMMIEMMMIMMMTIMMIMMVMIMMIPTYCTTGDGTTSVTVLCGELLREAEFLVNQRIHPMTIMAGWRTAVLIARQALEEAAVDNSMDEALFKEDLLNIARTTLSSKLLNVEKDHFAALGDHHMT
jgi:chaperonin GroEL (HSP60 family)